MPNEKTVIDKLKIEIIHWWLTKGGFLRRLGKKYPDFFVNQFIRDYSDTKTEQEIMRLRYTGEFKMKFEAIAITLRTTERHVYELHKNVVDRIISA